MTTTKPFAFVLMPFDQAFDDIYQLGIQATAKANDVVAERVDEQIYSETILERIYRQIDAADFVIADMTGRNPNVFYEVGYAHAKEKHCILITQTSEDIPFDLKHHRHIIYGGSIQTLNSALQKEIDWVKDQLAKEKEQLFDITVTAKGANLKTNDFYHEGTFDLQIDIKNPTKRRGPEIDAIYLFTTKTWTFTQDGGICSYIENDDEAGERRHMLAFKANRLAQGAWMQINCKGQREFWSKYGGEEPQDTYTVNGYITLEIATSEGAFRFRKELEAEFEEFPF